VIKTIAMISPQAFTSVGLNVDAIGKMEDGQVGLYYEKFLGKQLADSGARNLEKAAGLLDTQAEASTGELRRGNELGQSTQNEAIAARRAELAGVPAQVTARNKMLEGQAATSGLVTTGPGQLVADWITGKTVSNPSVQTTRGVQEIKKTLPSGKEYSTTEPVERTQVYPVTPS